MTLETAIVLILILMILYGLWFLIGKELFSQTIHTHRMIKNFQIKYGKKKKEQNEYRPE